MRFLANSFLVEHFQLYVHQCPRRFLHVLELCGENDSMTSKYSNRNLLNKIIHKPHLQEQTMASDTFSTAVIMVIET